MKKSNKKSDSKLRHNLTNLSRFCKYAGIVLSALVIFVYILLTIYKLSNRGTQNARMVSSNVILDTGVAKDFSSNWTKDTVAKVVSTNKVNSPYSSVERQEELAKISTSIDNKLSGSGLVKNMVQYRDSFGELDSVLQVSGTTSVTDKQLQAIYNSCNVIVSNKTISCKLVYVQFVVNKSVAFVLAYSADSKTYKDYYVLRTDSKWLNSLNAKLLDAKGLDVSSNIKSLGLSKVSVKSYSNVYYVLTTAKSDATLADSFNLFYATYNYLRTYASKNVVLIQKDSFGYSSVILTASRVSKINKLSNDRTGVSLVISNIQNVLEKSMLNSQVDSYITGLYKGL
jgi:hypothetical protein